MASLQSTTVNGYVLYASSTLGHACYDVVVGTGATVKWTLRTTTGSNVTAAQSSYVYRVKLVTTGTSTDTGATFIAQNIDGLGWNVRTTYRDGIGSNHPYLFIDTDGIPKVTIDHAANYTVRVFVEEISGANNGATYGLFGADAIVGYDGNGITKIFTGSTLMFGANTVLHSGNYNSYVPALTGTGASGTWGISITGNSATTSQTNFSTLTLNSATVATQSWVTSQGYVTGGPYLPLSGGNATGWVSFSSNTQGTPIIKAVQQDTTSGYYLFQGVNGSTEVFRVERTGNIVTSGTLSASGYNASNWNTAYGWGNHASAGYATTAYVGTQISNLIAAAPAALDTLNELAVALGNDANFSTTITNALAGKLSLSGGNVTGRTQFRIDQSGTSYTNMQLETYTSGSGVAGISFHRGGYTAVVLYHDGDGLKLDGNKLLTAGNYNSYSPTLGGTGASGTWPINVSGSASTSSTQASSNNSTSIATTAYVKSLFGAADTSGTLDWNDVSNTRPGSSPSLLLGTATNGMGGGNYYHPFNLEYSSKDGTGNVTQMAIAYGSPGNELYMRGRYAGSWGSWVRFLSSTNYNTYSPALTGTGASGTWGISITGNSATVTNGLYSTGSYANPAWITSLAWSKITGAPAFITGNQTITLSGDATGSGATAIAVTLANSGVTASTYGGNNSIPSLVIDAKGRITSASTVTPSGTWGISVSGTSTGISSATPQIAASVESNSIYVTSPSYTTGQITKPLIFDWYGNYWAIGNIRSSNAASSGFGIAFQNNTPIHIFTTTGLSINGNTALHSGNYNSYSPTLTGTGASGTWAINVTGSAGSVPFNNLTSKTSGTGTYQTSGDFRAPIFYDSDNTAYYGDFASTSVLNQANITNTYVGNAIYFNGGNNYFNWTGGRIYSNVGIHSADSLRAPIFYDSDDTGYYLNPNAGGANTSVSLQIFGTIAWTQEQWTWATNAHSSISPFSVRLWDQYSSNGGAGSPTTYGTMLHVYGRTGHEEDQLMFTSDGNILHRNCFYGTNTWNGWRTMLDSSTYNSYAPTLTGGGASGTWGISISGNSATVTNGLYSTGSYANPAWITSLAWSKITGAPAFLTGNQTITISGDATGSGATSIALTLANSGVTAGTYNNVTVNAKGLVTTGSNVSYLTGNQTVTLSGDATGSGSTSIAVTLANSGVTAGTYRSVTVDAKGRVTAGTNPTTISGYGITDFYAQVISGFVTGANSTVVNTDSLEVAIEKLQGQVNARISGNQTITLSGDVTGSGTTSIAATLANSGVTAATYGGNNSIPSLVVDAKGRITSASTVTPSGTWGISVSGAASYLPTLYAGGVQSNPQVYFGQSIGVRVAMTGVPQTWCDTLWINGYSGGDVLSMCALHTARNGQPRMWVSAQNSNSSSYGTTYEFLSTWNYNSYSPTLTGTGASGTWGINITGSAGSVPFNSLTSKTGGTGTYQTSGDFRAPIFYDSDNTAYYLDPNNTSNLNAISATRIGVNVGGSSSSGYGLSLYGGYSAGAPTYGMMFQGTATFGTHGSVSGDWATYLTMSSDTGRGWVFRNMGTSSNVASISNTGNATFNGTYITLGTTGGGIKPNVANGGMSLYGGDALTNGAYFTVTGISYTASPGAGSAECIVRSEATSKFATFSYNGTTYTGRSALWGSSGNFVIGSATTDYGYRLYVDGTIYATGDVIAYSDASVKTNVREITNPLARVLNTRGVLYDRVDNNDKNNIGFLAQDLEKEFPELVSTGKEGQKGVKYQNMVAVLIEAMKEQNKEIEKLKMLINGSSC